MDRISNGVLQGSISGRVFGGVTITSRHGDSAIQFDGVSSYVDFGKHSGKCFHSPEACSAGVTYSMWLWMGTNSGKAVVLDSGGGKSGYAGFAIKLAATDLIVVVKFGRSKHKHMMTNWNQDRWEHVVWIWHPVQGIRLFLNGCDTDPDAAKGSFSNEIGNRWERNNNMPFVFGTQASSLSKMANMKLDDMYIWNQVFNEHEVWTLYANGGMVA